MSTWQNPAGLSDLNVPGEEMVASWKSKNVPDKSLRENTRLAWEINPVLCVFLPVRLKNADCIVKEVCRLVRANPMAVSHIPEALQYLVTTETLLIDAPEVCKNMALLFFILLLSLIKIFQLVYMLTWARVTPVQALSYFSRQYPPHPISAQYAVRVLASYPADAVLFYIPQLVQTLRHDTVQNQFV